MWRGTTPTHTFTLPEGMKREDFAVLFISYAQNGEVVVEKEIDDLLFDGSIIKVVFTQTDTLKFEPGPVKIQLRGRMLDGQAVASNHISTTAKEILKDGEI